MPFEISEPLKKRLWQDIIKSKISNQASVLEHLNKDNVNTLKELSKKVLSGDAKNSEAFGANIYWKSLFKDFNRSDDDNIINSALNYGYAIIRGCMARFIVGAGLIPCFGIHHANKLNQFNLVDDIMEPYRPFMDYLVYKLYLKNGDEINKDIKIKIINILTSNYFINDEEINFLKAVEMTATSLAKSIKCKESEYLKLPILKKLVLFE